MPLTSRHVIGIEEIRVGGMRRSIAPTGQGQNKGFEKPTRVCQMPLRGAHIRHALNDVIFRHQRPAEPVCKLSHLMVTPDKGRLVGSFTETVEDSRARNTVIDAHIPLLFHLSSPPHPTTPRLACDVKTPIPDNRVLSLAILARDLLTRQSCR